MKATRKSRSSARSSNQGKGSKTRATARRMNTRAQPRGTTAPKGASTRRGGAAKRATPSRGSRTPIGQAIEILMADHRMVQRMFRQAERAKGKPEQLRAIVEAACAALTLHTEIEEQHLYPAMRRATRDTAMIAEAYVEHASAKQLIAELSGGDPGDEEYAARFTVLGEYVKHHIREEEKQIFPKARRARANFEPLVEALVARDEAVLAEGVAEEAAATRTNSGRGRRIGATPREGDSAPAARGATRGRRGRGRALDATKAGESTASTEDDLGALRTGREGADMEQPRRARGSRTQEDTGDLEPGARGADADSDEAESRDSTQGGR